MTFPPDGDWTPVVAAFRASLPWWAGSFAYRSPLPREPQPVRVGVIYDMALVEDGVVFTVEAAVYFSGRRDIFYWWPPAERNHTPLGIIQALVDEDMDDGSYMTLVPYHHGWWITAWQLAHVIPPDRHPRGR